MRNFDGSKSYESHEQPLSDRFADFVIDHIRDYQEPRELGEMASSSYTVDTAWQVVPVRELSFKVQNNDDLQLPNIHQRYYIVEMFIQNGDEPQVPIKLTLIDGENIPGVCNFYLSVDEEVEVPADDSLVEHMMATIDDFDIPNTSS